MFRKKIKGGKLHVVNNEDDNGIPVEQNNNNNANLNEYTPLIRAIQARNWHDVMRLLDNGANPNERDNI